MAGLTFMYAVHNPMGSGDHYRRAPRTTARTKIPNSTVRVYSSTQARAASAALAVSAAMAQRQEYLDARARSRIEEQEIHNVDHHDVGFALNTSTPSLVGASGTYGMHDKYASRVESSKRSRAKSHRRSSEQPTTSTLLQVCLVSNAHDINRRCPQATIETRRFACSRGPWMRTGGNDVYQHPSHSWARTIVWLALLSCVDQSNND
eukprot:scaffold569_cov408-Prasinococcus_capsulatus_cf.AAC.4